MKSKFLRGLFIYILILLIIAVSACALLWYYLDAYEKSQSVNYAKAYVAQQDKDYFKKGIESILQKQRSFIKEGLTLEEMGLNFEENTELKVKAKSQDSENAVTEVMANGKKIAEIAMKKGKALGFGFHSWEPTTIEFFPGEDKNFVVTVPEGHEVFINGQRLDERFEIEGTVNYPIDFNVSYDKFPESKIFSVEKLYGPLEFTAKDENGADDEVRVVGGSIYVMPKPNKSFEFIASADARVMINGEQTEVEPAPMDLSSINLPAELLKQTYMVYKGEGLYATPEIRVTGKNGEELQGLVKLGGRTVYALGKADNIPEERKTKTLDFCEKYLAFGANKGNNPDGNFYALAPYLINGSGIYEKLEKTKISLVWVDCTLFELQRCEIKSYAEISDEMFFCNVEYKLKNGIRRVTLTVEESLNLLFLDDGSGTPKLISIEQSEIKN